MNSHSNIPILDQAPPVHEAFEAGRRSGLAVAALIISLVSFVSLLGAEKAITGIVLGILAVRGAAPGSAARRFGRIAVGIGSLFLATVVVVLIVYWSRLREFIEHLEKLS